MSSRRNTIFAGLVLLVSIVISGCPPEPKEAIQFSNSVLDFERSEAPIILQVWNDNPDVDTFTLAVTPSKSWIEVNQATLTSAAPSVPGGTLDKQTLVVDIDRTQLPVGTHMGTIRFSASGIVTRELEVKVIQDTASPATGALNVVNPIVTYTSPYLIDFSFALQSKEGESVVVETSRLTVSAREGTTSVASETGVHVKRGTARQLKVALVLDYTLSMQSTEGAVAAMEDAALNTLLPALNEDALVSVTEFHREDYTAMEVVPFTVDRAFVQEGVGSIQSDVVQGFSAASRMLDAVLDAASSFTFNPGADEARYIIVFTDGNDTSSLASTNAVVNRALERGVRIYAINFGSNTIATDLLDLTRRTDGKLFSAVTVSELDDTFQQIVRDLDGQYTIRWASLRRDTNPFLPGFTLQLRSDSVRYTATDTFLPTSYKGDGVLAGKLRFVTSDSETATAAFLRADYVPRQVNKFRIYLKSAATFSISLVNEENDGLLGGWSMKRTPDLLNGGATYEFESQGVAIPFGTFGPMFRVTYSTLLPEGEPLFDQVYIDNSIYATTGGQSFKLDGYDNVAPGS